MKKFHIRYYDIFPADQKERYAIKHATERASCLEEAEKMMIDCAKEIISVEECFDGEAQEIADTIEWVGQDLSTNPFTRQDEIDDQNQIAELRNQL